ncbi:MAG: hypothetical protein ACOYNY_23360 [Caldilineaceae bacterium]|jgi:hypothetical protein
MSDILSHYVAPLVASCFSQQHKLDHCLVDFIIARQLPADALLWTRDPDFSPLAAALGWRLYAPS